MVICLERGANDLHMVQLMPLPPIISCFMKIQNGLPFSCRLTQVFLEKRPLNGCIVVTSNSCYITSHSVNSYLRRRRRLCFWFGLLRHVSQRVSLIVIPGCLDVWMFVCPRQQTVLLLLHSSSAAAQQQCYAAAAAA